MYAGKGNHRAAMHVRAGNFHRWLGKKEGSPITAADIARGKKAGGLAKKMAVFAENARHWKH